MTYWRNRRARTWTAIAVAVVMAVYATIFGQQTFYLDDMPFGLDWAELVTPVACLVAALAAWRRMQGTGSIAIIVAMVGFLVAQDRFIFTVPLGFLLVAFLTFLYLLFLPPERA